MDIVVLITVSVPAKPSLQKCLFLLVWVSFFSAKAVSMAGCGKDKIKL